MTAVARVLVAHDEALLRDVLRLVLQARRISVVAETSLADDLVPLTQAERPDVVVAGCRLGGAPVRRQLEALARLDAPVLVVSDDLSPETTTDLLRAGAAGILGYDTSVVELAAGVRAVKRGDVPLDPRAAAVVVHQWRGLQVDSPGSARAGGGDDLSAREVEVLQALAGGSTKAAARQLGLSAKTVEAHKTRIFAKLGVRTQAQAVAVAISHGLLRPADDADVTGRAP